MSLVFFLLDSQAEPVVVVALPRGHRGILCSVKIKKNETPFYAASAIISWYNLGRSHFDAKNP